MIAINQALDEFVSSNADNIIAEYDSLTTYGVAEKVREGSRIYQSISDANLGNLPSENIDKKWMDWEASNEYAMLDLFEETKTNFTADGIVKFERLSKEVVAIGNFNATTIKIEYLDDNDVVLETETYEFPHLGQRVDLYSYIYAAFVSKTQEVVYKPLKRLGTFIRISFLKSGNATECGYMISDRAINLGDTLDKVSFSSSRIRAKNKKKASFSTITQKENLNNILQFGRDYEDIPMLFIIDSDENSSHQKMATIARISTCDGIGENMQINTINWELTQN